MPNQNSVIDPKCSSMPIIEDQYRLILLNQDQGRSLPINAIISFKIFTTQHSLMHQIALYIRQCILNQENGPSLVFYGIFFYFMKIEEFIFSNNVLPFSQKQF